MTIHILPTQPSLDAIADIEQDTGRTLSANGELVERPERSALSELAYNIGLDYAKILRGDEL